MQLFLAYLVIPLLTGYLVIARAFVGDGLYPIDGGDEAAETFVHLPLAQAQWASGNVLQINLFNNFGTPILGEPVVYPFALHALSYLVFRPVLAMLVNKFVLAVLSMIVLTLFFQRYFLPLISSLCAFLAFSSPAFFYFFQNHPHQGALCYFGLMLLALRWFFDRPNGLRGWGLYGAFLIFLLSVGINGAGLGMLFAAGYALLLARRQGRLLLWVLAIWGAAFVAVHPHFLEFLKLALASARKDLNYQALTAAGMAAQLKGLLLFNNDRSAMCIFYSWPLVVLILSGLALLGRDGRLSGNRREIKALALALGLVPWLGVMVCRLVPALPASLPFIKSVNISRVLWFADVFLLLAAGLAMETLLRGAKALKLKPIGGRILLGSLLVVCLVQRYPAFRTQADNFLMDESWTNFQPESFLQHLKPGTRLATLTDPEPWSQDTKVNRHGILGSAGRSIILDGKFADYLQRAGLACAGSRGMTYFFVPNSPGGLADFGIRYCLARGPDAQMAQAGWIERAQDNQGGAQSPPWVLYESPLPVTPFHLLRGTAGEFLQKYRIEGNQIEVELPPVPSACEVVATFVALPGWKAWLDGKPAAVRSAENCLIRVPLEPEQGPAKSRKLILRYAPCSNSYLLACPAVSLGAAFFVGGLLRAGRARSRRPLGARAPSRLAPSQPSPAAALPSPEQGTSVAGEGSNRSVIFGLLLVAATVLAYQPAWNAGFIWDDERHITGNPMLDPARGWKEIWLSRDALQYYPLVFTSWRLERLLWNNNPAGYHWVNILLHAASAVLVWRVLRRLGVPGAWLAGALFALHPVNVESVAWISQRKNTLAMVFYLLSLLWFLRAQAPPRLSNGSPPSPLTPQPFWYWLSLFAFVCALLSKTAVAPLPFVLLGLAWWQRGGIGRTEVWRAVPFFAAALILGLVTVWFERHQNAGDIVRSDNLWSRLAVAGWAVWFYLGKALLPLHLVPIYPLWKVNSAHALSYLPGLLVAAAFLLGWRYRRTWGKTGLLAGGYFVLMLLPVLGFEDIGFMSYSLVADHWQYFAIIGPIALVSAAIVSGLGLPGRRPAWLAPALGGVLAVALGVLTWRQSAIYTDPVTYWRAAIAGNPNSPETWNNLSANLLETGQADEATALLRKTVELAPTNAVARYNLGSALMRAGQVDGAIAAYQKVIEIQPGHADAHCNLAIGLHQKGQVDQAIAHYQRALAIRPEFAEVHNNLGRVYQDKGQINEALTHYRRALEIQPGLSQTHFNLANLLQHNGQTDPAIAHYQRAIEMRPDYAEAHNNLGRLLQQQGRLNEAAAHFRRALEFQPRLAETHLNLADLLLRQRQATEASAHYQQALAIQPDFPEACNRLAWLRATHPQASIRNGQEAITLARRADQLAGGTNAVYTGTLAAAFAEAGRFAEAVETAQRALQLANDTNDSTLANRLQAEIKLYQAGLPCRPSN